MTDTPKPPPPKHLPLWRRLLIEKLLGPDHDCLLYERHPDPGKNAAIKFSLALSYTVLRHQADEPPPPPMSPHELLESPWDWFEQ